jgi:hypothetical protein
VVIDCAGGEAKGGFAMQLGGDKEVQGAVLDCRGTRMMLGRRLITSDLTVHAESDLAPYSPREHPGIAGFDYVSGRLQAHGTVDARALLARVGQSLVEGSAAAGPSPLAIDLRIQDGAFLPASFLRLEGRADAPSLELSVTDGPPATAARLSVPSIEIAGSDDAAGAPPLFASGPLAFTGTTPERRLSRLFAASRALRQGERLEDFGLRGALQVAEPRVHLVTPRFGLHVEARRLEGTVDLAGLLTHQIWIDGLVVDGAALRLEPKENAPPPEAAERTPWTVALSQARLAGVRELGIGEDRLVGPFDVELSASFSSAEGFEIGALTIDAPRLEVHSGGRRVSGSSKLAVDLKMAPVYFGLTTAREALRTTSGSLSFAGRVETVGILGRFLQRVPWLRIQGAGDFTADVALRDGRLEPGSQFRLARGSLEAKILDDVARGTATMSGSVSEGKGGARVAIDVAFPRYEMAGGEGEPPYVRGRDLRIALASGDLDLADVVEDLTVHVEARNAEVPDLAYYNVYLPPGAGLAIRSGTGSFDLVLDLDQAKSSGQGRLSVASPDVAVEFADVLLHGRLALVTKLRSRELGARRFDVAGTRLELADVAFHEIGAEASPEDTGWWAVIDLASGQFDWQRPMTLGARVDLRMRDSGFLLSLASRKKRFLSWFKNVLDEQDVVATGQVALGGGAITIDPLVAQGGNVDLRCRVRMSKSTRRIDLFVRHGHLAAGLELRDGKRDLKLLRPEAWYESREGFD